MISTNKTSTMSIGQVNEHSDASCVRHEPEPYEKIEVRESNEMIKEKDFGIRIDKGKRYERRGKRKKDLEYERRGKGGKDLEYERRGKRKRTKS
jgi:hypothetical protein